MVGLTVRRGAFDRSLNWAVWFLSLAFLSGSFLFASEKRYLQEKDILPTMQQILNQHVAQKAMSTEVIRRSFIALISNFDSAKIYLLQEEVAPYLSPSASDLEKFLAQYQQGNFAPYHEIEALFQKAILRARNWRQEWLSLDLEKERLKDRSLAFALKGKELAFAANEENLKERMTCLSMEYLNRCLAKKKETAVTYLSLYEKNMHAYENEYLYQDSQGRPLSQNERENFFALHLLKALASSLDAHTAYFDPNETYDMRVRLEKGFHGVGLALQEEAKGIYVTQVVANSPAAKEGQIAVKDRLVSIDGTPLAGKDFSEVMQMIRGEANSSVKLQIEKEGGKRIVVSLKRELIALNDDRVDTSFENCEGGIIGKITLHSFYEGENGVSSDHDIKEALRQLKAKGPLKGLILDLRNNLGGFLVQAVKVTGLFISNGVVVISKYSNGQEHVFRDLNGRISYEGPFVVLTSRMSASAAEIVAQALQDYGLAVVVGDEHTYGKGSIQHQTATDSNSFSSFKVTVGRYYTVSGKSTQMRGVIADIVVPSTLCYERIGEAYLEYPLSSDHIEAAYVDKLADIDEGLKEWYRKYYLPSLQPKIGKWQSLIPELKKRSGQRLAKNEEYQALLASLRSKAQPFEETEVAANSPAEELPLSEMEEIGDEDEETAQAEMAHPASFSNSDLQMEEAINIVKDMILLSQG